MAISAQPNPTPVPKPVTLVPNPRVEVPPGLGPLSDIVLGWLKWGVLVSGVGGILICAIMILIGRRNRNAMATEGIVGAAWIIGALSIAASAAGLVGVFVL